MLIYAVDPGTRTDGVVVYGAKRKRVIASWKAHEHQGLGGTLSVLRAFAADTAALGRPALVAVERISPRQGMGGDVLLTAEWSARLVQAALDAGLPVYWLKRHEVLRELNLGGVSGNRDSAVRRAMIERHGPSRAEAMGRKATPGPCYGVSSHAWQALGLAIAALEMHKRGVPTFEQEG